ncbi:Uncharacterized membrane protein YesL [Pelagirhabdus alkalitolerans]|uniref:Uncharacterized membrane protein YesL n=1 Tax=Pelagirhabdus alkalitolerans TaxID=1612202 RepID=A0A1G6JTH5_9BACI|nr:YesL family protein [Pelagirhabdus alkalitolerans]SDC21987.1 Uncharacterized membrane protein YesL [Pelagirhabdus alkalitolerans]
MDNNYGFVSTRFYRTLEWIWRLAYVNILWLVFSVLGLIVFGVFPATVSLYTVMRKWLMNEPDHPIIQTFFETYKKEFLRANLLGYPLVVMGYIIFFNYQYLGQVSGVEHTIISVFWYITVIIFALLVLFLFPLYVHYKGPLMGYYKSTILFALANPLALLSSAIALGIGAYIMLLIQGLIPFYSVSIIAWLIMWNATHAFKRLERKKKRIENNQDSPILRGKEIKDKIFSAMQQQ